MKTFEFLITESFVTKFDIEANTKKEAEKIYEKNGYDEKNIKRDCVEIEIQSIKDIT
tara:strand:+ start:52 stop:222 length:171 start_codon:yes stop_codon:yes gene_type:complete